MANFAFLFDVDGVIAETPHEESWKEAAIEYQLIEESFDFTSFYQKFVAGIPGLKGAHAILERRGYYKLKGISNEEEKEKEAVEFRKKKQSILEKHIKNGKFKLFEDIIDIVRQAKAEGIAVAVVSSSENSEKILRKAGIYEIFDSHTLGAIKYRVSCKEELYIFAFGCLVGKNNPNELPYPIVFEDADKVIEGVKKIGYKCIGIARVGLSTPESLKNIGADLAYDRVSLKQKGFQGLMNDLKNLFN